ncbi:MAG: sensor histidine kinase KdpD [Prolixibacteraceae bacterium]|jgi:two-component system sensor histidine kinase KdpD|nr:sensor histidine kinase KdpD [Prolixibacteraceae bacterium]
MESSDNRPDPDELLASIMKEEEKSKRGKLKIFFGMCAGVGKTYTMLQAAKVEKAKGCDIIIGFVETHNRQETASLAEGFELIQRKKYLYKSTQVQEMDLDAIITRKPQIVLVDELAHTNAPDSRHTKRYQDVLEILENGINVYTTVNVQHLESRSETVAQITGIIVRETLPDEIFENADEVELVDLSPDELLQRLSEGKVYTPERSREAILNFFRKGNITALREMALRIVADRVDKQLHDYMQEKRIRGPWKSGSHLLVAIDYKIQSTRLLRWAKNLSYSMGANIQAIYVETSHQLTSKEHDQLNKNINLAKQLGIKVRIVTNYDVVSAIVDFAQKENATHIIVGKPRVRNLFAMLRLGSFVNKLIRYSGNIDVYILGADNQAKGRYREKVFVPSFTSNLREYMAVILLVILSSISCYLVRDFVGYQIVSFGLLFLVSILAIFFGPGPILLAAASSALIWDYFFIPPQFTLHIDKPEDVLMLIMFFFIAMLNGILTSRVRRQEQKIRIREERTQALYQLTKELNTASGINEVSRMAIKYVQKYFNLDSAIILKTDLNQLDNSVQDGTNIRVLENDFSVANWVFKNSTMAGKYTDTLPSGNFTFYPLSGNSGNIGVIVVELHHIFTQGEEQFWEAFLSQISGKYEREFLRIAAKETYVLSESEKLYKTLFNSISHELRIPVATILGASDTLLSQNYPEETRQKLYTEISIASIRLNRLIENLLNMSRLESGHITPKPDWCDVHDLANEVAEALQVELKPFKLSTIIPADMPLVMTDFGLVEQVMHNLILNATQYAPAGSRIRLKIFYDNGFLNIQVMDRGTGFSPSELNFVFDKFYRGKDSKAGGTGLGLSIVKGFVAAQEGTIIAENRENGGAKFVIKIPVKIADLNDQKKTEAS